LIATDNDPNMLGRARRGCYSASSLKELPQQWLSAAFTTCDGLFHVKPEFRGNVQWRLQDIRRELPPERFQLILCRHLAFTYFDEPLQRQTLDRLVGKLTLGGILVTGKQEPLPRLLEQLEECGSRLGIYRKLGEPTPQCATCGVLFDVTSDTPRPWDARTADRSAA
jgi:chemotaxis protein methyltransferase CheR